jgi:hypothetical protein
VRGIGTLLTTTLTFRCLDTQIITTKNDACTARFAGCGAIGAYLGLTVGSASADPNREEVVRNSGIPPQTYKITEMTGLGMRLPKILI